MEVEKRDEQMEPSERLILAGAALQRDRWPNKWPTKMFEKKHKRPYIYPDPDKDFWAFHLYCRQIIDRNYAIWPGIEWVGYPDKVR